MIAVDEALERHLDATRDERLASFFELLRIPSISALPQHAPDMRRAAAWIVGELERIGFEHAEVSETPGHPIVYADWLHAAGAPTIVLYCHYDVQPVDPLDEWQTAPFDPFVRDGRVVARGAGDDKGQIHMHLRAAEALFTTRGRLPVNLRVVFEGEEESTSASLPRWLRENRDRLVADAVVISDTAFWEGNVPALTVALRGIAYAQIDVTGPSRDLHSGGYGGTVENPVNALGRIIAELKDRDGRVMVPGFYDDVAPLSDAERAALAALPFDEEAFRVETGAPELAGEKGYTVVERKGARPTLDVNGIWGGFQGEGSKTIIPASAHAKVSCRLVPDQEPERIFELLREHVLRVAPAGVRVEVRNLGTGRPVVVPVEGSVARAATRAIERTFGRTPLHTRAGGSIPVAEMFGTILGLPVNLVGFVNPDGNFHAPNESLVLDNYETGIRAICALWDELAAEPATT